MGKRLREVSQTGFRLTQAAEKGCIKAKLETKDRPGIVAVCYAISVAVLCWICFRGLPKKQPQHPSVRRGGSTRPGGQGWYLSDVLLDVCWSKGYNLSHSSREKWNGWLKFRH